ncbi:MAG: hypothetical protein ACLR5G_15055 [Eubacteriales bacterium]
MEKSIKKHKRKQITLADHFTTGRLLRFVLPSIVMMVFISIYGWSTGSSSRMSSERQPSPRLT